MRAKTLLTLFTVAALFLFFYLYRPSAVAVSDQSVEASLRGLGYESCGTYTMRPGGAVTFSKAFSGDVRCFIIVKRPGVGYMFVDPKINIVIEPPSEKTVYRYSAAVRFFQQLGIQSEEVRPYIWWWAGALNRTTRPPPVNKPNAANEDLYVTFSYKPDNDGFPVRVTLTIMAEAVEGKAPQPPSLLEVGLLNVARALDMILSGELQGAASGPPPTSFGKKLATQLGIKDIKTLMSYVGYELCGEFTAKDTEEIQKVELEVEIDLNEGRACYILLHPPPGRKAFLKLRDEHRIEFTGDGDQLREYNRKLEGMGLEELIGTHYRLVSAFDMLEIGRMRSDHDVVKPYSERFGLIGGVGTPWELGDNTPILIYFSYKGDLENFGEPLRFKLRTYTLVEFRIIPAKYFVQVN